MSTLQVTKISVAILFAMTVISFSSLCSNAQGISNESSSVIKHQTQTELKKSGTLQDLQSKLVDQYGVDGFRFVKDGELKEVKNQKTLSAKELSQTSGLDEYTIIIILAAIGAIAVILFIFK